MLLSILSNYLPYSLITAFTPGPNNLLALYAVSQNGWKKGRCTILGIGTGFLCVMLLCAVLCYESSKYLPALAHALKYIGAAYMLWLAVHIALSKPEESKSTAMSFWKAFLLQFVNVKIIMYALTIYTGYVLPNAQSPSQIFLHAFFLTFIGVLGNLTWSLAGGLLQRFLFRYYRAANLVMALILAVCAVKML